MKASTRILLLCMTMALGGAFALTPAMAETATGEAVTKHETKKEKREAHKAKKEARKEHKKAKKAAKHEAQEGAEQ